MNLNDAYNGKIAKSHISTSEKTEKHPFAGQIKQHLQLLHGLAGCIGNLITNFANVAHHTVHKHMYSWLLRFTTATGSCTALMTVGPTKV